MRKILLLAVALATLMGLASCHRDIATADSEEDYYLWQSVMREADADSYEWELNYSE